MSAITRAIVSLLMASGGGLLAGCATTPDIAPKPGTVVGLLPAEAEARAEAVRADPVGYLRRVAQRCRMLDQYTLTFIRYERRGFFRQMHGPEHIQCWFRQSPFSVRMKWLDEDLKYDESTYVAGRHDDKVRFVTRWWSPPLKPPPGINEVQLMTPVTWGESKRPLTQFGVEQMMARTLASLERAGDDVVVRYEGLRQLPDDGPTAHFIHLEYPASQHKVPIQELYINVATDLPAGTVLKFPDGRIDAAYYYRDIDTGVALTDADFLLDVERATTGEPTAHFTSSQE